MIYSEARLSYGFNVIYQADEYPVRFGLLVSALADPFDKTILAGFSVRHSPADIKYLRIDNGVFNYNKYIVQTFQPVDIMIPDINPPKPDEYISTTYELKPGMSFRFLTDESNGDYTIVRGFSFYVDSVYEGKKNLEYNFRDYQTANMTLSYNTPSVFMSYKYGELVIKGAASVNYDKVRDVILNAIQVKTDDRALSVDDPNYKSRSEFVIHFDTESEDFIHYKDSVMVSVDRLGNVTVYNYDHDFTQYRVPDGSWVRIFYRQGLMIDPRVGLTHIREYVPTHHMFYLSDENESIEYTGVLVDGVVPVKSSINLNHNLKIDVIKKEWSIAHRYKWIEAVAYHGIYVDWIYNISVDYEQLKGTDFDEAYFGISFTVNAGKSWFYLNDINNTLDARFVSFDPVVYTPIDPKILEAIFAKGISDIYPDYYPVDEKSFGYTIFTNVDNTDEFIKEYHDVEQAIEGLESDPKYLNNVVGGNVINDLVRNELMQLTPPPIKVVIVLQYYHDSNLIVFQIKDVADLTEHDCIIAMMETTDGKNFTIHYRDPVYQRMIPYAEWNDQTPSDLILNTSQLFVMDPTLQQRFECSNNGALIAKESNNIIPEELDSDYAIVGNFNQYNFVKLKTELMAAGIRTAVKLYSIAFFKSYMLLYDFSYINQISDFMKNIQTLVDTTGLVYKDVIYLEENQKAWFHVTLPNNVTRYMLIPIFSVDVTGNKYSIKANGQPTMAYAELNARFQNISKLEVEIECLEDTMLILGFAVLYDVETETPNTLRINNQHNKQAPYLDSYVIEYDKNITVQDFKELEFFDIYISYNLHLEDPLDETVVDVFLYDKFLTRFYELSQTKYHIKIPRNQLRLDDAKYVDNYTVTIPFTFRLKNKYGENLYPLAIKIYNINPCLIYIRDYEVILTHIDEVQNPDLTVTRYYNYVLIVSTETCGLNDVQLLFTKDYDNYPDQKVVYPVSDKILTKISFQFEESELPKTLRIELQNSDKTQYDYKFIELDLNN